MLNPRKKLNLIKNEDEKRTIIGFMSMLEHDFGFNFTLSSNGSVIEVQMVSSGLVSIPRSISRLPELYKLQLQSNKIKRLRNLESCTKLEILNLSDNSISSSELEKLMKLTNLQSLDLSYNKIEHFKSLNSLTNLQSLNLSNNIIKLIPNLKKLSNLKYLDLSENPIHSIHNIHHLEKIIKLKLTKANLEPIDRKIYISGLDEIKEYCKNSEK